MQKGKFLVFFIALIFCIAALTFKLFIFYFFPLLQPTPTTPPITPPIQQQTRIPGNGNYWYYVQSIPVYLGSQIFYGLKLDEHTGDNTVTGSLTCPGSMTWSSKFDVDEIHLFYLSSPTFPLPTTPREARNYPGYERIGEFPYNPSECQEMKSHLERLNICPLPKGYTGNEVCPGPCTKSVARSCTYECKMFAAFPPYLIPIQRKLVVTTTASVVCSDSSSPQGTGGSTGSPSSSGSTGSAPTSGPSGAGSSTGGTTPGGSSGGATQGGGSGAPPSIGGSAETNPSSQPSNK